MSVSLLLFVASFVVHPIAPASGVPSATALQSDPKAIEVAERCMTELGGAEAWEKTRYVRWKFFGRNLHYWDKWTGRLRSELHTREGNQILVLMNINTMEGRVWRDGAELTDPAALKEALERGHRSWVNDSYWMFMPYKLQDPGVTLEYMGEDTMEDGADADVLQMTFEEVGYTPQNRYLVYISKQTGLVEQWSYFRDAADEEPGFTLPWAGWQRFGNIMLATSKGRDANWDIAVFGELPDSVFTSPEPVNIQ